MCEPKIPGGYILLSRKIIESGIWSKPPLYIKIWVYLLSKAQHGEYKKLKRGQLITSIPEIMEDCSWYVGYRKVKPTKDQVYQVLQWLREPIGKISRNSYESNDEADTKATMIATTKATQNILVNIENYSFYQECKNYESNDESNNEKVAKAMRGQRLPDNINKNVKNDNNINSLFEFWNLQKIVVHKKITADMERTYKKAIKDYSEEEIKTSMVNYGKILKDSKYFFNYKWGLDEFLSRGIKKFLDWELCSNNFLNKDFKSTETKDQPTNSWEGMKKFN